jgi:hypothetical protein
MRERIRLSLGTMNGDNALRLQTRIESALVDGPASTEWQGLRVVLPADTFEKLAAIAGHVPEQPTSDPQPTWADLRNCSSRWRLNATGESQILPTACY